jgi:hypothetical protein
MNDADLHAEFRRLTRRHVIDPRPDDWRIAADALEELHGPHHDAVLKWRWWAEWFPAVRGTVDLETAISLDATAVPGWSPGRVVRVGPWTYHLHTMWVPLLSYRTPRTLRFTLAGFGDYVAGDWDEIFRLLGLEAVQRLNARGWPIAWDATVGLANGNRYVNRRILELLNRLRVQTGVIEETRKAVAS